MRRRTAVTTAATVAAAAGVALARRRAAARRAGQQTAAPPPLSGRVRTVPTEDGLGLHVEEHGPEQGAAATVVLAHGYVQSSRLWAGQVRDLLRARPDLRVVVYDQRGHGSSERTPRERATIAQLGRDLRVVIDAVAPTGPVLLVGHSMGGMTIMAMAEQFPDLVGSRVVGVAFVATSAGGLDEVTWGLPAPVARAVRRLMPLLHERAVRAERRGRARKVSPVEARVLFGRGADPAHVREVLDVQAACSAETMAFFLDTFSDHDRHAALSALADVPSLVVVGERDLLCPLEHSRAIAEALPRSELAVYPGVGHMVQIERRSEVSRHLLRLVDRGLAGHASEHALSTA